MRTFQKQYDQVEPVELEFDHSQDLTSQDYEAESNINNIMKRYLAGQPLPANVKVGTYGDFYNAPDFTNAQIILRTAQEQFDALPASVRNRFDNQPAKFLDFVHDKANLEEARRLGLLSQEAATPAPPTTTTDKAPVTPEGKP